MKHSAIRYGMNSNGRGLEQVTGSHILKIVPERLAEMVWFIKFRFLLLNIYFPFSGFQARTLFTFATVRIGVYTAPKCGTEPIRYVTLHFRD